MCVCVCCQTSEGLLEAWFGLRNLALDHSFYCTKSQPRLLSKSSSYEAFWVLNFDARILIMFFEWSMSRSGRHPTKQYEFIGWVVPQWSIEVPYWGPCRSLQWGQNPYSGPCRSLQWAPKTAEPRFPGMMGAAQTAPSITQEFLRLGILRLGIWARVGTPNLGGHWHALGAIGIHWGHLEWIGVHWNGLGAIGMDWGPAHAFKLWFMHTYYVYNDWAHQHRIRYKNQLFHSHNRRSVNGIVDFYVEYGVASIAWWSGHLEHFCVCCWTNQVLF